MQPKVPQLPGFPAPCNVAFGAAGGVLSSSRFACAVALLAALLALAGPTTSSAQSEPINPAAIQQIEATPKGTIGLGLIGAELGLIIPSVSGLTDVWALTVFPVVGAAGGALAGYYALDKPGREKGSVSVLVVGLAGVIPAVLVTVKGVREDRQERWEPESQAPIRARREQRARELAEAGTGFLRRTRTGVRISTPDVQVSLAPTDTAETLRMGGLRSRREIRLSLFSGVF